MSGETPNLGLKYLDPSQSQPEVKVNDAWDKIDAAVGSIAVSDVSTSPPIVKRAVELKFSGATVTHETGGVARIDISVGGSGGPDSDAIYLQLSASDLVTALSIAAGVAYLRSPHAFTIDEVRASLLTASSSGDPAIDVNLNGTSIFSTTLTIDATEKTSVTAATPAVLSTTAVASDDELVIDIDTAGTGAKGLIVTIIGHL